MVILKGLKCLEKGQYIAIAKTAIGVQNGYWSPKWRGIGAQNGGYWSSRVIRHLC